MIGGGGKIENEFIFSAGMPFEFIFEPTCANCTVGRAHCQRQVAFFSWRSASEFFFLSISSSPTPRSLMVVPLGLKLNFLVWMNIDSGVRNIPSYWIQHEICLLITMCRFHRNLCRTSSRRQHTNLASPSTDRMQISLVYTDPFAVHYFIATHRFEEVKHRLTCLLHGISCKLLIPQLAWLKSTFPWITIESLQTLHKTSMWLWEGEELV